MHLYLDHCCVRQVMGIWSGLGEVAYGYVATALVMLMSPALFPTLAIIVPVRSHASPVPYAVKSAGACSTQL